MVNDEKFEQMKMELEGNNQGKFEEVKELLEGSNQKETPVSKEAKFKELAGKRINGIVDDLRILANMAGQTYYEYSEEDVHKMFNHIETAVAKAKESYSKVFMEDFKW